VTQGFGTRLREAIELRGRLCVGIDPHPYLLSEWGLGDDATGLREFGLRTVTAAAGQAAAVKPQVAFFERHGSAGYAALETVLARARDAGLIVIADAKRGDMGTSVAAYGEAWLTPGSPLEADAVTLSAYQGVGTLEVPLSLAEASGKGAFILTATSNPEASVIQRAAVAPHGTTVARTILDDVTAWNATHRADGAWGSIGVVIGATIALADFDLDTAPDPLPPVLAPGVGHQGGAITDLAAQYGALAPSVLVSESRSILSAGPEGIAARIAEHANHYHEALYRSGSDG